MTDPAYKIVIIGSQGAGSSNIALRFAEQKFMKRYDPTIEQYYN